MLTICSNQYAYTSHLQIILRYLLLCLHSNLVSCVSLHMCLFSPLSWYEDCELFAISFLQFICILLLQAATRSLHFVSRFSIFDFSCLLLSCYKINLHCGVIHESCNHNKQDDACKDKTRTIQASVDQRYTPPNPMSKKMGATVMRCQNPNYIKQSSSCARPHWPHNHSIVRVFCILRLEIEFTIEAIN